MRASRVAVLCMVLSMTGAGVVLAKDARGTSKPVKVFLLSGQSNMTGRGNLGVFDRPATNQPATLLRFVKEPENLETYRFLYEGTNLTKTGWAIRDDVFITLGEWPHPVRGEEGFSPYRKHGGLAPHYGGRGSRGFGPELAIGHVLGDYFEETVVLVKVSFGGNSLNGHFRPPSSGGTLGDKYPKVVATAETRDFWRTRSIHGGHGTEQHWQANGESYWLIGDAMGRAMLKLLDAGD